MGREHGVLTLSESSAAALGLFQDLVTWVCKQVSRG